MDHLESCISSRFQIDGVPSSGQASMQKWFNVQCNSTAQALNAVASSKRQKINDRCMPNLTAGRSAAETVCVRRFFSSGWSWASFVFEQFVSMFCASLNAHTRSFFDLRDQFRSTNSGLHHAGYPVNDKSVVNSRNANLRFARTRAGIGAGCHIPTTRRVPGIEAAQLRDVAQWPQPLQRYRSRRWRLVRPWLW